MDRLEHGKSSLKIFDIKQLQKLQENTFAEIHRWEETLKCVPGTKTGHEFAKKITHEIDELRRDLRLIKQLRETGLGSVAIGVNSGAIEFDLELVG